nr:uncharacterized protein PB18E9.04c isoform X2 [Crassostrea gigas]
MSYVKTVYWSILLLTFYDVGAQLLHFCETNGKDPCEVANETVPFEPEARYVNCDQPSGTQYCDRYIVPGWYRYSERMWDQCPSLGKCGTVYPYWLNGPHPTEVNTEVQRSVCKVGFGGCCERQVTIKIRNCGQFMAYCLPALDSCPERYCFGESGPCTSTASQTTTKIFTTVNNTTVATTASTATTKGNSPQPITTTNIFTTFHITTVATTASTATTKGNSPQPITTTNIFTTFNNTYSPQPITTTTYPRTTKNAETVTDTGYSSPATTKTSTHLLQTVKAATNDGPSSSTTVIVMGAVIGILLISIIVFGSVVVVRKRNKGTDGNTYEEPFTTLQENTYETSANVYTNEEGGYEQLPVDHNTKSGYSVQSDDPYDSIDDRIRSGLSREEEINLEEK